MLWSAEPLPTVGPLWRCNYVLYILKRRMNERVRQMWRTSSLVLQKCQKWGNFESFNRFFLLYVYTRNINCKFLSIKNNFAIYTENNRERFTCTFRTAVLYHKQDRHIVQLDCIKYKNYVLYYLNIRASRTLIFLFQNVKRTENVIKNPEMSWNFYSFQCISYLVHQISFWKISWPMSDLNPRPPILHSIVLPML